MYIDGMSREDVNKVIQWFREFLLKLETCGVDLAKWEGLRTFLKGLKREREAMYGPMP
ncbi:MAG: hypothetical protein WC525_10280 [Candidatus Thermoplasmatota archaeon]